MARTLAALQRKIKSATDLKAVVETMKTLAAVNVGIYEKVDHSLAEYYRTIEQGLVAILHYSRPFSADASSEHSDGGVGAVVFGSDQGMVGQFNDHLAAFTFGHLARDPKAIIWSVGERIALKLEDGLVVEKLYRVPDSAVGITSLIGRIVLDINLQRQAGKIERLSVIYNRPRAAASYEPVAQALLPPAPEWLTALAKQRWPTRMAPQVIANKDEAFEEFIREYLFIALCRACAGSLVSENISRLESMQRAAKNIDELLEGLGGEYNQERQASITAELFDVVFGYDAVTRLTAGKTRRQ